MPHDEHVRALCKHEHFVLQKTLHMRDNVFLCGSIRLKFVYYFVAFNFLMHFC